jgi:hypothetical protein
MLHLDQSVKLSRNRIGQHVAFRAEPLEPTCECGICFQASYECRVPDALVAPEFPIDRLQHDLSQRTLLVTEEPECARRISLGISERAADQVQALDL